jgi:hypothetical protein
MSTKIVKQKSKSLKQGTGFDVPDSIFNSIYNNQIYFSQRVILLLTSFCKTRNHFVYLIASGRGTGPMKPRQPFSNERGANSSG